jgi:hypothetical protein
MQTYGFISIAFLDLANCVVVNLRLRDILSVHALHFEFRRSVFMLIIVFCYQVWTLFYRSRPFI